jgi:hypothetical protein
MARFRLGSLRLSADHSFRCAALVLSAVAILSAAGAEAFAERPGSGDGELFPGDKSSSQMMDLLTQPSVRQPSSGPTDWASSQQPQNSGANTEKEVDPFSKKNYAHGAEVKKKKDDKPNNGCGPNGCPSPGGPCGPGGCPSPGGGGGRRGGLLSKLGGGGGGLGGLAGLAGLAGQNQGSGSGGLGSTSGGTSALESEIAEKEDRVAELERQAAAKEATKSAEATAQSLALTPTVTPTVTPTATGSVTPGDNVTPQPTVAATASVVPTAGATVAATATVAPSQGSATQSSLFPAVKLNM